LNDGQCIDSSNSFECVCNFPFTGVTCGDTELDLGGSEQASGKASAGAIAGGIVGGLICVLLIVLIIVVLFRRSRPEKSNASIENVLYDDFSASNAAASRSPVTSSDAFVPGFVNPLYSWYQPELSKEACVNRLQTAEVGAFIIRDFAPTPGWHMLHIKGSDEVLSEKIKINNEGLYQLVGECVRDFRGRLPTFEAIPELVKFYASHDQHQLPVSLVVDTPIYDNSNLRHGQQRQIAISQEARPALPLRSHEAAVAGQFLEADEMYTNQMEAKQAIRALPSTAADVNV
jgi:hypothetical protein